jgi:hypothetical protein
MGAGETKTVNYGIKAWWTIVPAPTETSKVTVVMGGVDITNDAYKYGSASSRHITIESITDDVVITYER